MGIWKSTSQHKEQALHKLTPVEGSLARFTAPDPLLAFLTSL